MRKIIVIILFSYCSIQGIVLSCAARCAARVGYEKASAILAGIIGQATRQGLTGKPKADWIRRALEQASTARRRSATQRELKALANDLRD